LGGAGTEMKSGENLRIRKSTGDPHYYYYYYYYESHKAAERWKEVVDHEHGHRIRLELPSRAQMLQKLDAGQSPTLARPAAPLAACVQRISSVVSTATSLEGLKTNFRLTIYSLSYTNPGNGDKIGPVDFRQK